MKKLILILLLCSIGCLACWNPFEPRKAENPSNINPMWNQPENPIIVISNLEKSYENRHLAFYLENFTENFNFIADPYEKNGPNSNLYKDWDRVIEENVASLIFDLYSDEDITLRFTILPDEPDPTAPSGTATIYRKYEIAINNSAFIPPSSPAKGIAIFHMIEQTSGYWAIQTWTDQKLDTIDWGEFKGNFR